MLSNEQIQQIEPRVKAMQVIIGALIIGPLVGGIILYLVREQPKFTTSLDFIAIFGIAMAAAGYLASFIAPIVMRPAILKQATDSLDETERTTLGQAIIDKLLMGYQTIQIIRCSLIEGMVFANLLLWIIEGSVYNLAAAGVGFILLAFQFPFPGKVVSAIEDMFDSVQRDMKLG